MKIEFMAEDPVRYMTSSEFADQGAVTMNYKGEVVTCEDTARVNLLSTRLVHAPMLQTSHMMQILVWLCKMKLRYQYLGYQTQLKNQRYNI